MVKVFVLGGTGAIGRNAVPALVGAGHEVTALVRTRVKADMVSAQGADPVLVSMFDGAALTQAFRGHEVVVNLATAMPSPSTFMFRRAWAPTERVRIEGSAVVASSAVAAGIDRLVQESVCMLYPDCGARWIDETVVPDVFPACKGNLAAEASAERFAEAGGIGVVLRLGLFYGPGARNSEQFLALARRHVVPVFGEAGTYISSIHMADAARAVVAALSVPGGVYNVTDDEPLTKREYAQALSDAVGKRAWLRGPGRLALLAGDRLTSLTRSLRVSNRRFREVSGWQPKYPSAREGWAASASAA